MSKIQRPKSGSEAKQRRARIARKRWRKPALAAMKSGGAGLVGVDKMLALELSQARRAHSGAPPQVAPKA
jgi:hypothetical protein